MIDSTLGCLAVKKSLTNLAKNVPKMAAVGINYKNNKLQRDRVKLMGSACSSFKKKRTLLVESSKRYDPRLFQVELRGKSDTCQP